MKQRTFLLILFFTTNIFSQNTQKLDDYIATISKENNIPGIALAIIKDGKVIHKKFYGESNLDYDIKVSENTLFPLFSTSKIFATVAIHKLIQENKLSLKDKVSEYVDSLPEPWRNIKIQNLITHSSGLPEIAAYEREAESVAKKKVYNDSIKFNPGEKFDYNQTNFWLLNQIVQKVEGISLPKFIMTTQFQESETSALFDGSSSNIVKNRATSYWDYPVQGFLRETDYNNPPYLYGASGFNITLSCFIEWNKRFDINQIINEESKKRLFKPFQYQEPKSYTNGWYMDEVNGNISYYYTGSFSTGYKKFIKKDLTIIFLTNGSEKLLSVNSIMKHIAGLIDPELIEE